MLLLLWRPADTQRPCFISVCGSEHDTERCTEAWWENRHEAFFQTALCPQGFILKPPVHSVCCRQHVRGHTVTVHMFTWSCVNDSSGNINIQKLHLLKALISASVSVLDLTVNGLSQTDINKQHIILINTWVKLQTGSWWKYLWSHSVSRHVSV